MVIDSFQKRFVMNMQLRQCFSRAKPFRLKKAKFCLALNQEKPEVFKKARSSKSGFKKAKFATQRCLPVPVATNNVTCITTEKHEVRNTI